MTTSERRQRTKKCLVDCMIVVAILVIVVENCVVVICDLLESIHV